MSDVGVHYAKTNFSKLLRRVAAGEEIIITSSGRPVAKLGPLSSNNQRRFGVDEGTYLVPENFNDPLPESVLDAFEK